MTERKTNVDFVTHIMEYSDYGALKQAFIISALDVYSRMCIRDDEECKVSGFIDPQTWQDIAREVNSELLEHFKRA